MARTKATVRRMPRSVFVPELGQRIGNKYVMNRRNVSFKIKKLLPEAKRVQVKKNGEVLRTMNVRRKTIFFTGRRRIQF